MAARRIALRLAAFFAAFAAALSLVALFTPAPRPVLRGSCAATLAVVSCPPAAEFVLAENLDADVELVSLDRENARSYARLRLRLVGGSRAPERLWARTYFFDPSDQSGRVRAGDVVELARPFAEGDTAGVTVSAPCSWCKDAPAGNYFARVELHEDCANWERCAAASFPRVPPGPGPLFDIRSAVPVAVHVEGMPPARR